MSDRRYTVALLGRGDNYASLTSPRLAAVAKSLAAAGIDPVPLVYSEELAGDVRARLSRVDGVLVWVNPIEDGRDRASLDAMLRELADDGVFVSAHPGVIQAIGTKEVLFHTREMGWGSDVRLYRTPDEFRVQFPLVLAQGTPRVLKQYRGNGGDGVWKVAAAGAGAVRVRHAKRGSSEETLAMTELFERFAPYFDGVGRLIDQAYQPRLTDGMVRCYLAGERVVGFGEQKINALFPAPGNDAGRAPQPGPRLYFPPTRPDFQALKSRLENDWLPALCRTFDLSPGTLPIIWDADFLYGPRDAAGNDTYVLCEINVSSVYPFPDEALTPLAFLARDRLDRAKQERCL